MSAQSLKANSHADRELLYDEWYGIRTTLLTVALSDEERAPLRERFQELTRVLKQYPFFRERIEATGN